MVFDPYEYLLDLCNESCLSFRLSGRPSCMAKAVSLDIHRLFN